MELNKNILEKYEEVKQEFLKRFPDVGYTMTTITWDDGDFRIEAKHGEITSDKDVVHVVEYYSGRGTIKYYSFDDSAVGAIKMGKDGREYFVPKELIKHLKQKTKKQLRIIK